jgi:preprotein translocase subunit Sec61beta
MAEKVTISTPMGSAGVLRFYESGKGLKLEPTLVVMITVIFLLLILVAKFIWQ